MSHATLAPSGAKAWRACPGSLWLTKGLVEDEEDAEGPAAEGTLAHALAAHCLTKGIRCQGVVHFEMEKDPIIGPEEVTVSDPEMIEHVAGYIKEVLEASGDFEIFEVESRIQLDKVYTIGDQFGTSDVWAYSEIFSQLNVHDLKYGRHVKVEAKDNDQLIIYALGAMKEIANRGLPFPDKIVLYIHQPRNGGMSSHEYTIDDMHMFEASISVDAVHAAECYNSEEMPPIEAFHPGDSQCRYCKGKTTCPAITAYLETSIDAEFSDETAVQKQVSSLATMDNARLAKLLPVLDLLQKFIDTVDKLAKERITNGEKVEGYKCVLGKAGHRKWKDEKAAEERLKQMKLKMDEMYDMSIKSPPQIEKVLKAANSDRKWKSLCEEHIVQEPGKPTYAPISDKREEYIVKPIEAEFEEVQETKEDDFAAFL